MARSVLHIGKFFPPHRGGMETFLADLMVAQKRQGLAPAALVHASGFSLRDHRGHCAVQGEQLPVTRAAVWLTLLFAPIAPLFWLSTLRALRRQQPELLHLHMPNASVFWLLLLPQARKLPWVVHWHADVLASTHSRGLRLLYPLYRPLEQAVLRRSAAIIATSPPYLHSSVPLQAHRDRCEVIPLGLDTTRLGTGPTDPGPAAVTATGAEDPALPLSVLAIGRLTYYKGFRVLIDAAAAVPGMRVSIVGAGDQATALQQRIDTLQLNDRVTLCGPMSDRQLAAALRGCDLLCQPSLERTEAFGVVLLEAMALGKPVLASDVSGSGMPWLVRFSAAGTLVPPGDVAALAAELLRLGGDRAKLKTLGEAGRSCFEAHFRIDIAARAVADLYGRLLTSAPS
ncbi:MAG: glycosyltransferase involved in cell wall biosynthesis [Halieaceae bacterium]|jgi:glycosyltransferase involved in cell wall biosynthesis